MAAVSVLWTAAVTGFFGTACVTLCASVTIQTCYQGSAASRLRGLVMAGSGLGTVTTLMPIAARAVFGGREYAAIWGILSAVSNLGAMTAAPLFGMAFDLSGSYAGAMTAAAVLLIPALAAMMAVFRK